MTGDDAGDHVTRRARAWMDANLATQGYCLPDDERRRLWLGLRFATGVCLPITIAAVVLGSPVVLASLAVVAAVAGFGAQHPFDHIWNGVVRHPLGAPELPRSPARRRHAFKVATAMLLTTAGLFALGEDTAALVVGGMLVAACTAVTTVNLCVPSVALSLIERLTGGPAPTMREPSA